MNNEELIQRYLELVLQANERVNLTRIDSLESARVLHIEDSLSALPELEKAPEGLYGDLGTGGGFPGVPLAIMSGRQTMLIDSVKKKIAVLSSIVEELGLSDRISTYDGRIEDLALEMKGQFSVLTARALSQLPSLVELASPLLKKHGQLICFKAQVTDEEVARACDIEKLVGMKLVSRRNFLLSDQETYREIIVFEKIDQPKIKLPRRVGMAQRHPLP